MERLKRSIVACLTAACICFSQEPPKKDSMVERIVSEISGESIKATVEKLVSFGTRHSLSDTASPTRGIGAARRWIKSEFERYAAKSEGRMAVEFFEVTVPPSSRLPHPTRIVDVVATLSPGPTHHLMPERILLVEGHYDSRASNPLDSANNAPGANDDGSGTALVLELARVMSRYRFDARVIFMAVAGEEQGLMGSAAFAEMAGRKGLNIEEVLNNDIVGSSRGEDGTRESGYARLFSEALSPLDTGSVLRRRISQGLENDGVSRTLARYIKEIAERYNPAFGIKMIYRLDRFLRGGDHQPFHDRGFAAVRFNVAKENYDWQHQDVRIENGKQYGDLLQFMDFEYCANVARMNAAALAALALAPAPASNVSLLVRGLGYGTQLTWSRNKEPDVSGYYVRYRETNLPEWQGSVFTSDTTITVKMSKDDYIFAVQGVDKGGNPTLPALLRPVR